MSEVKRYDMRVSLGGVESYESPCGDYVDYEDYAALAAKCVALAAENAAMHETIEAVRSVADNSSGIAGWHLNGDIATWEEILPEINDIETPATDAFLFEVRAQGVDSAINRVIAMMNHQHPVTSKAIDIMRVHSYQLRKGGWQK